MILICVGPDKIIWRRSKRMEARFGIKIVLVVLYVSNVIPAVHGVHELSSSANAVKMGVVQLGKENAACPSDVSEWCSNKDAGEWCEKGPWVGWMQVNCATRCCRGGCCKTNNAQSAINECKQVDDKAKSTINELTAKVKVSNDQKEKSKEVDDKAKSSINDELTEKVKVSNEQKEKSKEVDDKAKSTINNTWAYLPCEPEEDIVFTPNGPGNTCRNDGQAPGFALGMEPGDDILHGCGLMGGNGQDDAARQALFKSNPMCKSWARVLVCCNALTSAMKHHLQVYSGSDERNARAPKIGLARYVHHRIRCLG